MAMQSIKIQRICRVARFRMSDPRRSPRDARRKTSCAFMVSLYSSEAYAAMAVPEALRSMQLRPPQPQGDPSSSMMT